MYFTQAEKFERLSCKLGILLTLLSTFLLTFSFFLKPEYALHPQDYMTVRFTGNSPASLSKIEYIEILETPNQEFFAEEQTVENTVQKSPDGIPITEEEIIKTVLPEENNDEPKPINKSVSQDTSMHQPEAQNNETFSETAQNIAPSGGIFANDPDFLAYFLTLVNTHVYYPKNARKAGIEGTVHVKVVFDGNGYISSVALQEGDYHQTLGSAALKTMETIVAIWTPVSAPGSEQTVIIPVKFLLL